MVGADAVAPYSFPAPSLSLIQCTARWNKPGSDEFRSLRYLHCQSGRFTSRWLHVSNLHIAEAVISVYNQKQNIPHLQRQEICLNWSASRKLPIGWVIYATFSAGSTALMSACVRVASQEIPQSEIVFFRSFIALLLLLPLVIKRRLSFRTQKLGTHLVRSIFGFATMYLYFYALAQLQLADAMVLVYTYPLFVSLLAFMILGEQLNRNRKVSIIIGFLGVCCLFHPSSAIASVAGLIGLLAGLSAGVAQISIKKLSITESGLLIVVLFSIFSSIFSFVPMLFEFVMPDTRTWLILIAIGGLGNLTQLSLTRAYQLAPASQVAPIGYASLVFAGLLGFLFWSERPDLWMLVGTVFVVIAGILVAREQVPG